MGRYKAIIGPGPHARSLPGQRAETSVGIDVLNLYAGRPDSVRNPGAAANVKLAGKSGKACSGFTGYEYVRSPASFTLERSERSGIRAGAAAKHPAILVYLMRAK
jgi:hypothetical protein